MQFVFCKTHSEGSSFAKASEDKPPTVLDRASIAARHKMRRENRKIKKPSVLRLRRDKPTAVTIKGSK